MALTALAVGSSLLSTSTSIFGALKGADARKKVAEQNARLTFFKRMEEIRRMQREQAYVEGSTMAGIYASNIQMSGSAQRYLTDLKSEHRRQATFARNAAKSERDLIKQGGQSPGLGLSVFGQAASGLANAAMLYHGLSK